MDLENRLVNIEFRHLRALIAVAEDLNFTRAAERLRTTQPSLSRTIASLEQTLGTVLVRRDRQSVDLTAAGTRFLPYARLALGALQEGVEAVTGPPLVLRICFAGVLAEITGPAVKTFERMQPGIQVDIRRYDDPMARLLEGRCHLAFLLGAPNSPALQTLVLTEEVRMVALPAGHRLARQDTITLRELSHETLVVNVLAGTTSVTLWDESDRPTKSVRVRNIDEWMEAIALGRGIGVTPASTARFYSHPQIEFRALSDAPRVPVVLAWRKGDPHPNIPDFTEAVKASLM
ncbi:MULTISPECIES: LysR family transcriptional regulator [Arthrobacter]|uniref:LysR family transcriptional regulator n=1 Tax=Arthrobacter terricola TaxID=2547396 RepID=A0A4R5KB35_9MICC|nr:MULTISPECIES: LysR substrate-binding domain-containing protein [Arthrobacter]MBT8163264.1 LysR family transcriptional regulator [Arthrobacter sp. GN70]TDF91180.1 LysR family transcriptional regulator [Arthrobacter terricola]